MFPSPARKNPGVDKITFEALERRVAALEALVASGVVAEPTPRRQRKEKPEPELVAEE